VAKADVAELVDARDLKSLDGNVVWVRVPPPAPKPGKHDGGAMPDDNDLFDEDGRETRDEFDRLTQLLSQHLVKFAEDQDIPDEMLAVLLLRIAIASRMVGYVASTARPSAGGLKLDLDRFRRDIDDLIRVTKKDAEGVIARTQASIVAAELDEDED
jgi:hypothetical protein